MEKYARKCDVTSKGMNEGYCINDGQMYIKEEADMIAHLRDVEKSQSNESDRSLTDAELLYEYYENDYYYWTEWDGIDEDYHFLEDGTYVETIYK